MTERQAVLRLPTPPRHRAEDGLYRTERRSWPSAGVLGFVDRRGRTVEFDVEGVDVSGYVRLRKRTPTWPRLAAEDEPRLRISVRLLDGYSEPMSVESLAATGRPSHRSQHYRGCCTTDRFRAPHAPECGSTTR